MRFGDFEVLETAGAGATGTVYRARDVRSGKVVAVKVVSPDAVAGLEQEAATLRRLQHRHLVRLLETGTTEDGRPWLAQAWVDGVGLDRLLQVHGTLTAEQAVGVLHGALQGLAHAHEQGVVHRDVAPGNVLVDTAGTSMLVDFGIAAPVGATGVRGTPAFLSPEAAAGAAVGPTSDVYSAGAVLHLLLAGQPVFPVADVTAALQAHRTTAPPRLHGHGEGFADLLQRCLAKSPADRPPDAGALLSELDDTADRRFGAGWLARASVAALVPAARAAGSGTAGTQAAGAARETVVLTTGAVSTGAAAAAAPAPAASTAPAAAQAPVQPPAPPSAPRRLRVPKTGPAIAATVIAVAVIAAGTTAVVALTGNDPSTEDPVSATGDPDGTDDATGSTDESADDGTGAADDSLVIPIGPFCDRIDTAAAPALVGGPVVDTYERAPGDPARPDGDLPSPNYGCLYAAEPEQVRSESGGTITFTTTPRLLELVVRGTPATRADYEGLLEADCASGEELPVDGLGELSSARACSYPDVGTRGVSLVVLGGDGLFICSLERPAGELDSGVAQQAVEFCSSTARALAGG